MHAFPLAPLGELSISLECLAARQCLPEKGAALRKTGPVSLGHDLAIPQSDIN